MKIPYFKLIITLTRDHEWEGSPQALGDPAELHVRRLAVRRVEHAARHQLQVVLLGEGVVVGHLEKVLSTRAPFTGLLHRNLHGLNLSISVSD